jgi:hypothetical protein
LKDPSDLKDLSDLKRFEGLKFERFERREGDITMGRIKENGNLTHYPAVNRSEVPQGRQGKHRKAVSDILSDVSRLGSNQAVKVPLSSLNGEKMQNLRSALNRVTRQRNIPVVTSSDGKFLYVWRSDTPNPGSTA